MTGLPPNPTPASSSTEPVIAVRNLTIEFPDGAGNRFTAVGGVSFEIAQGEIVAIVGESGSGKSLTARSLLRLVPRPGRITHGEIVIEGTDIRGLSVRQMRKLRGSRIAMVFQDPMTALNPVQRVGTQIAETVTLHQAIRKPCLRRRVITLFERVGIKNAASRAQNYPHEYSGGMRQRAVIAMGIANSPALLVADEPTTALDVTVQDQIMNLMRDLNETANTAILLISHNLAVVASVSRRVIVMYAGRIVEEGPTNVIFARPEHPYTWALLRSIPRIDTVEGGRLAAIAGQPPDLRDLPRGCKFHPRCPFVEERCTTDEPPLELLGSEHRVRCWVPMRNAREPKA